MLSMFTVYCIYYDTIYDTMLATSIVRMQRCWRQQACRGVVACSGSAGDGRDVGDADVLSAGAVSRPGAR